MEHGSGVPSEIDGPGGSGSTFTTDTAGIPDVTQPEVIRLKDGDRFEFRIGPVRKRLDDADLRMLAYNGSIPGPILHVDQGSEITVDVTNDGDVAGDGPLARASAGEPIRRGAARHAGADRDRGDVHLQGAVPGRRASTGTTRTSARTSGSRWASTARSSWSPRTPTYWPAVDRHLTITLDDLLVEDGHIAAFNTAGPNFTAMGRFGNVMLINGEPSFAGEAAPGEVVRLYVVNTANTRIFNLAIAGARAKLVGGDSGRYERETFVDEVLLAPSERAVIDVLFDAPGPVKLEHRTPEHTYDLGAFTVTGDRARRCGVVLRDPARGPGAHGRASRDRARPRTATGQGARVLLTDAAPLRRGRYVRPPTSARCIRR